MSPEIPEIPGVAELEYLCYFCRKSFKGQDAREHFDANDPSQREKKPEADIYYFMKQWSIERDKAEVLEKQRKELVAIFDDYNHYTAEYRLELAESLFRHQENDKPK